MIHITQNIKKNIAKAKAIERDNRKRLLKVNPKLNDKPGIYFLTRTDELGIRHAYVGQALHILTRLAQHLSNFQYIDNSIRKHGLYSEDNPYGYRVNFINFPVVELDEKERYYIMQYSLQGYQMKNRDTGGGAGKQELGERKPSRGYYDGLAQGRKNLARELSHIIDKHLIVEIKPEKAGNKVSQKMFEKFNGLLNEYEDE